MTVNIGWSEVWLSLFDQMDSPTKTQFLRDVDIVRLVQTVTEEVQLEILEHAPVELTKYLQEYLYPKVELKLLGVNHLKESKPNKVYLDIVKRMMGT